MIFPMWDYRTCQTNMLDQVKGPNSDPIGGTVGSTVSETMSGGGTTQTQSPRLSTDGTASLGSSTAQTQSPRQWYHQTKQWYCPVLVLQAMVPPNIGSGIAKTQETQDETFFSFNFEAIWGLQKCQQFLHGVVRIEHEIQLKKGKKYLRKN